MTDTKNEADTGAKPVTFACGSLVQLRSGGPKMTAGKCNADGMIPCYWHTADGESRGQWYWPEMLVGVKG